MNEIKVDATTSNENQVSTHFHPILIAGAAASMFVPLIGIICAGCSFIAIFNDQNEEHKKANKVHDMVFAIVLMVSAIILQVLSMIAMENNPDASSNLLRYLFNF